MEDREGVALLVDGPNVFRDRFEVDLDELLDAARDRGRIAVGRVYLDENASAGLIRAVEAHGLEAVVTSADVDVSLAIDAVVAIIDTGVATLAIASRDLDFKPVFDLASRRGVGTIAIAPGEFGRSPGLANAADEAISLEG